VVVSVIVRHNPDEGARTIAASGTL
jgi:hypothetical protein